MSKFQCPVCSKEDLMPVRDKNKVPIGCSHCISGFEMLLAVSEGKYNKEDFEVDESIKNRTGLILQKLKENKSEDKN